MKRTDRLSDIKLDESGLKYEYQGGYYEWGGSSEGYKRLRLSILVFLSLPTVLLIACGCVPESGMDGVPAILIPYALTFVSYIFLWYKSIRFFMAGEKIRKYVFEETTAKLPVYSRVAAMLAGLGCTAVPVLIVMKSFVWVFPGSILYLAAMLAALVCGAMLSKSLAEKEGDFIYKK